ncbi:MAG: sulfatase [Acidobacteria bacterium]|nr:sulfatase [Acidobacteriota bacterium]
MLTRRALLSSAAVARPRQPNVLLVLPDQLRAQSLGCYGNAEVQTPNVDALARQGVVFDNTIANSPVCCPARAILLTGQYCHVNGMTANDLRLRESSTTLSSILKREGYRTGFIGKWHLDGGPREPGFVPPGPRRHGFDFWAAHECSHRHFNNKYFRDTPDALPVRGFEPEGWTDLALEFLAASRTDARPFFLTVQMGPPHDPYGAPPEYMSRYNPSSLPMRPNWRDTPRGGRREIASYYAAITAVDEQLGRMMRELDRLGLSEDTIVVFSSDHGDMLGSQGAILKRKPWEESIRVPGIVRYPGRVRAGRRESAIFTHADFAPTLLRLCGAEVPRTMQGADLTALLTGRSSRAPDAALLQIFGPYQGDGTPAGWRGLRTARYTYARFQDRPWVLYDNQADPFQIENLATAPAAAKLRTRLDAQLQTWMARTGDSWAFNWSYPVEDGGRLY